ncbi:MAG: prepilin-type N-terminal cleavage/methylation domain-containing protein [Thermodesulfovibrionales bacterium]
MRLIAGKNRLCSDRGVTLVEVMISLVIMLIIFVGLIQASLLGIEHNLRNELRDEAVRIASQELARVRSMEFATIPLGLTTTPVTRTFRNLSQNYFVDMTPAVTADPNVLLVTAAVRYAYKDENLAYTLSTYVRSR